MEDPRDRSDRFELIAVCDEETLGRLADRVLSADPALSVRQEPRPQLVMQRVREPVERRPFNLGEVVVTPAEVDLDGARGFAMRPGKAERGALAGAIVDAAVAGGHRVTDEAVSALESARADHEAERAETRRRSRHTTVEFGVMEDDL
ncbi:MAG: phosphonate C-P lyase system protein PhnG [Salinirussus sp.]